MARFINNGTVAISFMSSIPSTPTAPTQAELSAGVDCVGNQQDEELIEIGGFSVEAETIPTPGLAGVEVGNVAGANTYPSSYLDVYKDDTVETIYSALTQGTTGFLAIMYDGQGDGEEHETFPVRVVSRVRSPEGNTAHRFRVNFAISSPYTGSQAS